MKQFLKNINFIRNAYTIILRTFFFEPWPTKPLEFWTILNLILIKIKPESILELGSGRSTYYFYEYTIQFKNKLESIEHNWTFYRFIQKGLRSVYGKKFNFLKFIPIKADWYDASKITTNFDFLFIDGPNTNSFLRNNVSRRFSNIAIKFLINNVNKCKIIIIDDIHKNDVMELIKRLNIRLNYIEYIYNSYNIHNYNDKPKLRIYYQKKYEVFIYQMSKKITKETNPNILKIAKLH